MAVMQRYRPLNQADPNQVNYLDEYGNPMFVPPQYSPVDSNGPQFSNEGGGRGMAQNDRMMTTWRGDVLNQQQLDRAGANEQRAAQFGNTAAAQYLPMIEGRGGYAPDEAANITREGDLNWLQQTPEEAQANYLTPYEQQQISGNPDYKMGWDPNQNNSFQMDSARFQRGAGTQMRNELQDAANQSNLNLSDSYNPGVANALTTTEANVRGAIDPNKLVASQDFLKDYNMSPEEQQRIVTGAGISAGTGYRAREGDTMRAGAAAGMSPLGIAAINQQYEQQAAGEAGDAMTQARIAADREAAARKMAGEQLREQGEGNVAGLRTSNEQALGDRRLNQVNAGEQLRLNAARDISSRRMGAATTAGQNDVNTERAINAQETGNRQFNAQHGLQVSQAEDAARSGRAAGIAQNRQAAEQTNQNARYGRGMDRNAALSGRYGQVANMRLGQQQAGLGWAGQQQAQANQNAQNDYNRQLGIYGTQTGGTAAATGNQIRAETEPAWWERAAGAVAGLGSAFRPYGGGKAEGGVATKPTVAIVGENGPEYVGPVGDQPEKKNWAARIIPAAAQGFLKGGIGGAVGGVAGQLLSDHRTARMPDYLSDYGGQAGHSAVDQATGSDGQIVTKPTLALIGDDKPEVVVPLGRGPAGRYGQPRSMMPMDPRRRRGYGEAA